MAKVKEESKSIESILDELNKKYGKNAVVSFDNTPIDEYDIIPSGSIAIDYQVLGIGGFAKKKMYTLKGWQGSNKSTLCGHVIAKCQEQGGSVLYIDGEHAIDKQYFSQLGVQLNNKFMLSQPDYGEMGFEVAYKIMKSRSVDLVIIDSDSSLLPKAIMEGEFGQQSIGKKAKMNSENYPKLKVAASQGNICVISVAQYRVDPGKMFGDNRVIPGGHALEYYSDCVMELTKTLKKEGDETCGTITNVKTQKNKTFIPYREAKVETVFGFGISKFIEVIKLGSQYSIWKKYRDIVTYGEDKYPITEFEAMLESNQEFYEDVKRRIIEKIKENPTINLEENKQEEEVA